MNGNNIICFDSFGAEHISIEIRKIIENKNIKTNIYRAQAYDFIMRRYFALDLLILC